MSDTWLTTLNSRKKKYISREDETRMGKVDQEELILRVRNGSFILRKWLFRQSLVILEGVNKTQNQDSSKFKWNMTCETTRELVKYLRCNT